jgi:hypothetical protein
MKGKSPERPGRGRRGGGKRGSGRRPQVQHTSVPTGRAAYAETRRWLIDRHGPVCAYCGRKHPPADITLDHVAPRRGQSAYDRRDNLVLACKACNAAKADMPLLSFLFRRRERAAMLARYGTHLSEGLRDVVRQLAGEVGELMQHGTRGELDPDSPYRDVGWREPSRPIPEAEDDSPYAD